MNPPPPPPAGGSGGDAAPPSSGGICGGWDAVSLPPLSGPLPTQGFIARLSISVGVRAPDAIASNAMSPRAFRRQACCSGVPVVKMLPPPSCPASCSPICSSEFSGASTFRSSPSSSESPSVLSSSVSAECPSPELTSSVACSSSSAAFAEKADDDDGADFAVDVVVATACCEVDTGAAMDTGAVVSLVVLAPEQAAATVTNSPTSAQRTVLFARGMTTPLRITSVYLNTSKNRIVLRAIVQACREPLG